VVAGVGGGEGIDRKAKTKGTRERGNRKAGIGGKKDRGDRYLTNGFQDDEI
jgi:hypothetical protein